MFGVAKCFCDHAAGAGACATADKRVSMSANTRKAHNAMEVLNGRTKRHESGIPLLMSRALALGLVIGACALCLVGQGHGQAPKGNSAAAASAVSAQTSASHKPDPASVERGKTLFSSNCGFCHGANANGGETGPDLIRSLIVLDDDRGELIGAVVSNGRLDRGMPKFTFSDDQMSDLVTFLHNRVQAAAAFTQYQVLNIVTGDAKAGESYFNGAGGCSACHSATGDLAHVGSKYKPVDLQQRIIMPRGEADPKRGPSQSDGSAIEARITLPSGAKATKRSL